MPPIIVSNSRSSSLRNPCPDGTGIGYGTFNDTIFVICDTTFYRDPSADNLALGLGLGLGLGIPFLALFVIRWLVLSGFLTFNQYQWWGFDCYCPRRHKPGGSVRHIKGDKRSVFPRESVEGLLSESALGSFRFGNLTEELKNELMVIRLKFGRDLTEFVKFAEQLNYPEIADWISKLNPGTFPPEIQNKARGHIQVPVSDEMTAIIQKAKADYNTAKQQLAAPNHELP